MYLSWIYALSVVLVGLTLPIFSYLTLIYRELGRMTTGRVHEHLDIFEAEIEPKLKINRRSGGRTFRILGHFWLAFLVLETTRGVRSEEHTSELQSRFDLVCRLLLEKKKKM